jgi:hypothetical protein
MEEQHSPQGLTNDRIVTAAKRYMAVLEKAIHLLPNVDDSLLAGTPGTVYLKKLGHRPLTGEDSENIIRSLGSDEEKKTLIRFSQAQQALSERLKKNKWSGLIIEQSGIHYLKAYRRIAKPELWKGEEMIRVIQVLDRLQV